MRIIVIGGVGGGMSAAARARRLMEDAEIIVLDKGADVSVATCGFPYFLSGEIASDAALRVQTPASLHAALNLDVRVNHEAVEIDAEKRRVRVVSPGGEEWLDYDALVLSPGAEAFNLPTQEGEVPCAHHLRTIEDAEAIRALVAEGAKTAAVIGAGFIGVEAAENLAEAGLDVHLIEAGPQILAPFDPQTVHPLRGELRRLGITIHEGSAVTSLRAEEDGGAVLVVDGAELTVDSVVLAMGIRPRTELAQSAGAECENGAIVVDERGRTTVEGIWAIGDAVVSEHAVTGIRRPVPLAGPANRMGRLVADDIAVSAGVRKHARSVPQPHATAIIRVGKLMAASTGANRFALEQAGIEYHAIHTVANNHVTYFPGATPMALTVYIAPDGEILGAQGVGLQGIDRRIDVFATAMRAGMHVEDLIDLDLCYAPPFGTAKDAVNIVGMIGENILGGDIELWYPWELEEKKESWAIVDVRRPDEHAAMRVPGSLCVPHTQMRERMDEIIEFAAGRPIALHCKSGFRSYLAYRMLKAQGLQAASLSGGIDVMAAFLGDDAQNVLEFGE